MPNVTIPKLLTSSALLILSTASIYAESFKINVANTAWLTKEQLESCKNKTSTLEFSKTSTEACEIKIKLLCKNDKTLPFEFPLNVEGQFNSAIELEACNQLAKLYDETCKQYFNTAYSHYVTISSTCKEDVLFVVK